MQYTQAQIDRANAVSLEDFLLTQGETLIKSGREYRWKEHDSLTVRGNKWFRHSQSKGGYPIDFVMEFYGKSFPEAVQMLTGENGEGQTEATTAPPTAFHLPLHNRTADRAIQYLCESRGLNKTLVEAFLLSGDIYEDAKRHNVVFVGRDRSGTPRYAHVRGTADPFRQDIAGSDKSYPFHYEGNGNQLFVFEAPIDLLSFICLYPQDWQTRSYLALGGVSGKALDRFLSERKETIDAFNTSDTRGNSPSYGTTFQKMGHELLSRDELAVLDGGKCILQLRGVRPFLSDKYDLTQHPNYKLTSDYDPKNTFDIEKYLNRKEKINSNDEFVVIDADSIPSA